MKFKNKQTGEIKPAEAREDGIYLYDETTEQWYKYELDLLAKWWEYYEEPKEYWFIDYDGGIIPFNRNKETATDNLMKQIGNYFETKEEAEKAVKKLNAWERLQKKFNFHITGWDVVDTQVIITTDCDFDYVKDRQDDGLWSDLDLVFNGNLLFGGEE